MRTALTILGLSNEFTGTELIIPYTIEGKSVTRINYNAFSGCSSLSSINLPNTSTTIGGMAFDGCRALKTIELPDSVTKIGANAFMNTPWGEINGNSGENR